MNEIRIGIIGFGGSGRPTARRLSLLPEVNIVSILDSDLECTPHLDDTHLNETIFYKDVESFFATTLDAVSICSPDHTHFQYAEMCVALGIPTLVEKPMLVSLEQCRAMAALLENKPILFGAHHQKRFLPAFRAAHEIVAGGELGDIVHMELDYIHDMRVRAHRFCDWRIQKENPQQVALGLSSHSFDLVRWVLGKEVESVYAIETGFGWPEYPAADSNITMLSMTGGTSAKVSAIISSRGPQRERISVFGTKGRIHDNLLLRPGKPPTYTTTVKEGLSRKARVASRVLLSTELIEYPYSVNEHNTACSALLNSFVSALRGDGQFPIGFSEGAAAVRICIASMKSASNREPVRMSELAV